MAPFGDVAPALELCRAASGGAGLDVVRPLALAAVTSVVPADVAVWVQADLAHGGHVTTVAVPDRARSVCGFDPLRHRPAHGTVGRVEVDEGHAVGLEMAAPPGHRVAIGLRRAETFTDDECARLEHLAPVIGCAVLAAWRSPAGGTGDLLTRRETAVLRSVATGMSDKQAARALGVSPRTVGKHLEHIYAKLGVAGRTEAAARVAGR